MNLFVENEKCYHIVFFLYVLILQNSMADWRRHVRHIKEVLFISLWSLCVWNGSDILLNELHSFTLRQSRYFKIVLWSWSFHSPHDLSLGLTTSSEIDWKWADILLFALPVASTPNPCLCQCALVKWIQQPHRWSAERSHGLGFWGWPGDAQM